MSNVDGTGAVVRFREYSSFHIYEFVQKMKPFSYGVGIGQSRQTRSNSSQIHTTRLLNFAKLAPLLNERDIDQRLFSMTIPNRYDLTLIY